MRPRPRCGAAEGGPFGNILNEAYDSSLPKRERKKAMARALRHMSNTRRRK